MKRIKRSDFGKLYSLTRPKCDVLFHQVQRSGKEVTTEDVARARGMEATDQKIHDTVLIAAAFCMYNCYVDGLDT